MLVFEFSYDPANNIEKVVDLELIQNKSQAEEKIDHTFI